MRNHFLCPFELKTINEHGHFSGYASVFNVVDTSQDVIEKGAFTYSLSKEGAIKQVKCLWQHRLDEPIGIFHQIKEDAYGLYVEGQLLLAIQRAHEAYLLLKSGALQGLSIGYTIREYECDTNVGYRMIKSVDLWEISLVTFPANPEAGVINVKQSDSYHNMLHQHELLVAFQRAIHACR